MRLASTNGQAADTDLRTALFRGLAPDGGLYLPRELLQLPREVIGQLPGASWIEVATVLGTHLLGNDLDKNELSGIIQEALDFPIPLVRLGERVFVLELFHGPTLAFKDVGARFMARLMARYLNPDDPPLTVLAATSGDTGSAVAHAFLGVPNTRSVILYPEGQVSDLQERLFTTLGENVTALSVLGSFDDCQRMVKEAFLDDELRSRLTLTSANSINVGRLLPQIFYYFHAWGQLAGGGFQELRTAGDGEVPGGDLVLAVPSGNLGNLCAGLMAKRLGLPASSFVAACNSNDVFPSFLETGEFHPQPSRATISNAMDVGNPSNLARIMDLYDGDAGRVGSDVMASSHSDADTLRCMAQIFDRTGYTLDPHTAVGYLAMERALGGLRGGVGILLATAHPVKFGDVVREATGETVEIPDQLKVYLEREPCFERISPDLDALREALQAK
ncbi:threonine synthase [Gemmatimonadota bacterium]